VRQCAAVRVAVCDDSVEECGSASSSASCSVRQCAAVLHRALCGSVWQCARQCTMTVRQCAAVRLAVQAAVCGSAAVQQCAAWRTAVCGSACGSACLFVINNNIGLNLS
jgi:hypothetical protein